MQQKKLQINLHKTRSEIVKLELELEAKWQASPTQTFSVIDKDEQHFSKRNENYTDLR